MTDLPFGLLSSLPGAIGVGLFVLIAVGAGCWKASAFYGRQKWQQRELKEVQEDLKDHEAECGIRAAANEERLRLIESRLSKIEQGLNYIRGKLDGEDKK